MNDRPSGPPSFAGRIIGALSAFFFTALTLVALPFFLGAKSFWLVPGRLFTVVFFIWVAAVSLVALVIGFRAGAVGTVYLLSHLWDTAEPMDRNLRDRLWLGVLI